MRALSLSLPLFAAIGCGISTPVSSITQPEVSSGMQGMMHGGQQPVVGATVSVYAMSTAGYGATATLLGTPVTTNANGGFSYGPYTCPANNPPVYILGRGGNAGAGSNTAIALVAGIGNCNTAASVFVNISEVTTVATAYALSHFFNGSTATNADSFGGTATQAEGNNIGMVNANLYTIPLLVNFASGNANTSNGNVTLESAKLNSIANSIAACVNSAPSTSANCVSLFNNTPMPGGTNVPSDTLQAAVHIALYPYQNVSTIYNLGTPSSPYVGLPSAPADFTLAASYTAPALGLSIAGSATSGSSTNIDIDATGRVWFPSNTTTAHGIAYFDPASTSFSPAYGTGVKSPQYVAIDTAATPIAYASDLAGNTIVGVSTTAPTAAGSITYTQPAATSIGPITLSNTPTTANAILYAAQTSAGYAFYEAGPANTGSTYQAPFIAMPTGLAPYTNKSPSQYYEVEAATSGSSTACRLESSYADGTPADASNSVYSTDATTPCITGGAAQMLQGTNESVGIATTANQMCDYNKGTCFNAPTTLTAPEGIALDGDAQVWIANSGNSSVTTFSFTGPSTYGVTSPVPYAHTATMPKPYGIAIDRSGNVWVSNAGCVNTTSTACTPGSFVLSELIGAAAPTLTPLVTQNGITPTGGSRPMAAPIAKLGK